MIDQDAIEKYKKAGRIYAEVRDAAMATIKPGMTLVDIVDFIETMTVEKGARMPFPVNSSLNDIAAHYAVREGEETRVQEGDLLKIDTGAVIDGYIADSAFTYCSEKSDLITTAERALAEAIKVLRPGITVGEVSETVQQTVEAAGLGLVVNLTGHGIEHEVFHAPPTIPNIATGSPIVLEEGQVIAIEPFVVESNGHVKESGLPEIYRFLQERPIRSPDARAIQQHMATHFGGYPFAKRWLEREFSPVKVSLALRQLEAAGAVETHPPLKEESGQMVAQAEHTVIVSDPPVVITE